MDILIIGAGDIGSLLAKRLTHEKHNITIIESNQAIADYAREHLDVMIIDGSAASVKTLLEANIDTANVVAALSDNDEVNIIACQIAKKYGKKTTIARVRNPEYLDDNFILSKEEIGVDYFIQPEKEAAEAIARLVRQSNATDIIEFDDGKLQLIGIRVEKDAPVVHTQLMDIAEKFGQNNFTIVAIKRNQFTIIPKGSDLILKGDQIFIVCDPDNLPETLKIFGKYKTKIENVLITGGGMISRFLCEKLDRHLKVKIIEKDLTKANFISENFHQPLVIHGDGSDLDLLNFEGIMDMDVFIAITGDDETNIITSLIAKHLEVPRTITLIRKNEYLPLTPTIGMDSVISKQQMTVNSIQRYIRQKQVALFAELPGMDAEIIEYIAKEGSKIVKKPLSKISFPKGSVVGAVMKGDTLVVPKGDTHVNPQDRVIIFAMHHAVRDIDRLFN